MNKFLTALLVLILPISLSAKEELFIYNWSDYIAEDTIANFEEAAMYIGKDDLFLIGIFQLVATLIAFVLCCLAMRKLK